MANKLVFGLALLMLIAAIHADDKTVEDQLNAEIEKVNAENAGSESNIGKLKKLAESRSTSHLTISVARHCINAVYDSLLAKTSK